MHEAGGGKCPFLQTVAFSYTLGGKVSSQVAIFKGIFLRDPANFVKTVFIAGMSN